MQSRIGRRGGDCVSSGSGLSEGKPTVISDEELKSLKLGYETYGSAGARAIARAMGYRLAPSRGRGAARRFRIRSATKNGGRLGAAEVSCPMTGIR